MRRYIKASAKYVHTILLLAIITPTIYALAVEAEDYNERMLYLLGLLAAIPVLITGITIKKCKSLFFYLLVSIVSAAGTIELAVWCGKAVLGNLVWGYVFFLAAEIFWVILENFLERVSIDKDAKEGDTYAPDWKPRQGVFEKPRYGVLALFVVSYLVGLGFSNSALCNQALGSAVLYLFLTAVYSYVERTEEYLELHKRVCNLPSKRIYGIGGGMLAAALAVIALFVLGAAFTGKYRQYTDLRDLELLSEISVEQFLPEETVQTGAGGDMMEMLQEEAQEAEPLPYWVEMIFRVLTGVILLGFLAGVLQAIRMIFKQFRENYEENGDIVEELKENEEKAERLVKKKRELRFRSQREQVRYQYRRFIRKHRKEKPGAYETPYEIETLAEVAESEEGKIMHRMYEEARYGRES
ncbi:MAG: hypothetical protein J5986_01855 [Roseburia sp.]|nr:hypothetical protein [Roseburia sp.]